MPKHPSRELTVKEKRAIRRLVTSMCACYDREYGCLPLDGECYMFTRAFTASGLCRYFRDCVLPLYPGLEAVFRHRPVRPCKLCGGNFPVSRRQTYCSTACADAARKAATAKRVRKHRRNVTL